jgi:hypothetical protein
VGSTRGSALGRQPIGHRDRFHERGLAGTVLSDQERHALAESQPVADDLRHGGDRHRPLARRQVVLRSHTDVYDGRLVEVHDSAR